LRERNKLPRGLTLKSSARIRRLLRTGRRFTGEHFVCVWQPEQDFRYAVLVGRKFGTAVRRNRIKRLLRETLRLSRGLLSRPVHMILLPKAHLNAGVLSFDQFNRDMQRAVASINRELER
jgi:ribonuclease P protein component